MTPSEHPKAHANGDAIQPAGFTPLGSAEHDAPRQRFNRLQPKKLAIALLLIAFLGALLFLINARSLQVAVVAETATEISIPGLALPFGERYLLLPGEHTVHLSAEGYLPLTTTVEVDGRENQSVEFALQPLPGRLSIDSTPQGATVSVDGEILGTTPVTDIALSAGSHELVLQEARHLTMRQTLQMTGRNVEQQLQLELLPAWAEVSIDSLPANAAVLVDGAIVGQTPAQLELLQGEHKLALQLPGYATWERELRINAGQSLTLGEITLQPADGSVELDSIPSGANVTVNGVFHGQTPLTLQLDPDMQHELSLSRPGYQRYTQVLNVAAADSSAQTIELQPLLGEIRFNIRPASAVLYIQGRAVGSGSRTVSLPAVAQTVEVRLPGHASQRRRITPRPGLQQVVDINLLTEREAVLARLPAESRNPVGQTMRLFIPAESELASFEMGASRREPGRRSNEVQRNVTLQRMFYLSTSEVTNAQFRRFQADHNSGLVNGRSLNRDSQPAVQLSWQQAASFCNWLSRSEGLTPFYKEDRGIIIGYQPSSTGYRLPTEAEWAWVARSKGSALLKFPWGDTFPPKKKVENYADRSSAFITGRVLNHYDDGFVVSAPVASFGANQHGIHDLGGNAAEWVHDVYTIPEAGTASATDPMGPQTGDNYVIRGASWSMARLPQLRLSYRDYGQAGRDDVGFRIARYAE